MLLKKLFIALAAALSISLTQSVIASDPSIPYCDQSYGTLALREPNTNNYWWRRYNLENPEALLKYYVTESGCFTMVDRGEGMDMRMDERGMADSGELQVDSNFGKGQVVAADFFLVPDLLAKDSNSAGKKLGGFLAGKLGGKVGGVIGGVKTKKLEAEAILTLVNARTSVQQASTRGKAQKTDVSFGGGGLIGGIAGLGGGYADTNIGRVISAAYADAYTQLVDKVKGSGASVSTDAPNQSYSMAVASELYTGPSRGSSVRKLRAGMTIYPTGKREGAFMEAKDKFGTTGWVSVEDLK